MVTKKKAKKKTGKKVTAKRQPTRKPEIPEESWDQRYLFGQDDIASLFGVTVRSVQSWPVKPKTKRGRRVMYYLPEVIAFRMQQASAPVSTTYELTEERSRLTHHQANLAALEEQQRRDELFDVREVVQLCAGAHAAARNRVLGIHSKVASRFPELDPEIIEEIEEISVEAINELGTDGIPTQLRDRLATAYRRLEGAAAEDGKPVG